MQESYFVERVNDPHRFFFFKLNSEEKMVAWSLYVKICERDMLFSLDNATAKFVATKLLPVPPLPPETLTIFILNAFEEI